MLMGGGVGVEGMYIGVYFIYSSNLKYCSAERNGIESAKPGSATAPNWGEIQLNQPKVRRALGHRWGTTYLSFQLAGSGTPPGRQSARDCRLAVFYFYTYTNRLAR